VTVSRDMNEPAAEPEIKWGLIEVLGQERWDSNQIEIYFQQYGRGSDGSRHKRGTMLPLPLSELIAQMAPISELGRYPAMRANINGGQKCT